jgi:hypothetical protein
VAVDLKTRLYLFMFKERERGGKRKRWKRKEMGYFPQEGIRRELIGKFESPLICCKQVRAFQS